PRLRSGQALGRNTRNCRPVCPTAGLKPRPRACLATVRDGASSAKQSRTSRRFYRFTKTSVYRIIPIALIARSQSKWRNGDERNDEARMPNDKGRPKSGVHARRAIARDRYHRHFGWTNFSGFSRRSGARQKSAGEERSHPNRDRGERVLHRVREISVGDRRYSHCEYRRLILHAARRSKRRERAREWRASHQPSSNRLYLPA